MGLFKKQTIDEDLIACFGRHQFLGSEAPGGPADSHDWWSRTSEWRTRFMTGGTSTDRAYAELNRVAERRGGWVAIGAWKLMLEFGPSVDTSVAKGAGALTACVRAYDDFGVTNLAIHLPRAEAAAYEQTFGRPAPMDGFWGPPVFRTPNGPQKSYYLNAAAQAAAARRCTRLAHIPGEAPPGIESLTTTGLWDYARLVLLGPLLVPADCRDEAALLAEVSAISRGSDHRVVLARFRELTEPDPSRAWAAVGAARFTEEFLDPSLVGSTDHTYLLDAGIEFLHHQRLLPDNIAPACLSRCEFECLTQWSS